MDSVRTYEPPSLLPPCIYDIFLSFRGEDTRNTFLNPLYEALRDSGFRTYKDDREIERGENINSELEKAIKHSRSSILVISKNYANSSWCLDELVMIIERKRCKRQMVLPVFYYVDPFEVRNQTGSFAEAFAYYERELEEKNDEKREMWKEKVKGWRAALKEVADFGGMVFGDQPHQDQPDFIHKVVENIEDKLNRAMPAFIPYLVGIDSRVKDINLWLQDGSNNVSVAAICGMSGIGKTTIARYAFSTNYERFEVSIFLENINDLSEKPNGLIQLQRKLLHDLTGTKENVQTLHEGVSKIKEAIYNRRILLVLDDVNRLDQVQPVLVMSDWLFPGSKVIITTRNMQLIKDNHFQIIYDAEKMTVDESMELFCLHAFGKERPVFGYSGNSAKVVSNCGGLPLALQVLGSSLRGKTTEVWESAIRKLEEIPANQIHRKLKLSYDSLINDHDRNLFLDIVCFFIGRNKDYVIPILDACGFYAGIGLQNLIDRCMLTIEKKKLGMHQMLRDMGREIVRQESTKHPGRRTRLWKSKDSLNILLEKTGTETIEGLVLDQPTSNFYSTNSSERLINKSLVSCGFPGFLTRMPRTTALIESISVKLESKAFKIINKLRLLEMDYVKLDGDPRDMPKTLRWLCWRRFTGERLPNDFPLENLAALDIRCSRMTRAWFGTKFLPHLVILNLSHSHRLSRTPDFSGLLRLEKLILKGCINLVEICESIGYLQNRLLLLNLKYCESLKRLPKSICMLKVLEKLILTGCSNLEEMPKDMSKMESLKEFYADEIAVDTLPSINNESSSWYAIVRSRVLMRRKIPELSWISLPHCLVSLSLSDCNLTEKAFPNDFGNLPSLKNLNLTGNPLESLPGCIRQLPNLEKLEMYSCKKLQSIIFLPQVKELGINYCTSLEMITFQSPSCFPPTYLIDGCEKLFYIQTSFRMEAIEDGIEEIPSIYNHIIDSIRSIDQLPLYNFRTHTLSTGPVKALYERGLFSVFFPGNEVPSWFDYSSLSSKVSCVVPSCPNLKVQGLSVCGVYTIDREKWTESVHFFTVVSNLTKKVKLFYGPACYGVTKPDEYMVWLSHWNIESQLDAGDELLVSVLPIPGFEVKEVGFNILYNRDGEPETSASTDILLGAEVIRYQEATKIYCFGSSGVSLDVLFSLV